MLGLNDSAVLRARTGTRGGRPAYAEQGQSFRCRCEPELSRRASGDSANGSAQLRIFAEAAEGFDPRPGDRIEWSGASCVIVSVRRLCGLRGAHHLEIEAKEATSVHGR